MGYVAVPPLSLPDRVRPSPVPPYLSSPPPTPMPLSYCQLSHPENHPRKNSYPPLTLLLPPGKRTHINPQIASPRTPDNRPCPLMKLLLPPTVDHQGLVMPYCQPCPKFQRPCLARISPSIQTHLPHPDTPPIFQHTLSFYLIPIPKFLLRVDTHRPIQMYPVLLHHSSQLSHNPPLLWVT